MAARKAYEIQLASGLLEDSETFDTWRHRETMTAVRRPGITSCYHDDFRPLLAHFQHLAGDDAGAYSNLVTTGPAADHGDPQDTHEARRQLAYHIVSALDIHHHLVNTSPGKLLEESVAVMAAMYPQTPWGNTVGPERYASLIARQEAVLAKGKGPITAGYVLHLVRSKTRRQNLTLAPDFSSGLADRCTVRQLRQILATLKNRIASAEGTGSPVARNKSQRNARI
jgi:hypothetical protein